MVRTRTGKLQLRLAHRGKLTRAAEQLFLRALAASANVRLSAAAAGASARAFYRRREQCSIFAREMRLALETGYDRLRAALLEQAASDEDEAFADNSCWRAGAGEDPLPKMTVGEAMQLLCLHEAAVLRAEPRQIARGRQPWEAFCERARVRWTELRAREAEQRAAEARALARAARYEETGGWRMADEAGAPPPMPPLDLVTGWSRAKGEAPHHAGVPLFGGWRRGDMEEARRRGRHERS